jgi:hypothetical protein
VKAVAIPYCWPAFTSHDDWKECDGRVGSECRGSVASSRAGVRPDLHIRRTEVITRSNYQITYPGHTSPFAREKGVTVAGLVVPAMASKAFALFAATSYKGLDLRGAYLPQWARSSGSSFRAFVGTI